MTSSDTAGTFDPSAAERLTPDLVDTLRRDRDTRVLLVDGDRMPVGDAAAPALRFVDPASIPAGAEVAFLGRDQDGSAVLLAAADRDAPQLDGARSLREFGAALPDAEAEMAVAAVALGRWLRDARHCPACGEATLLATSGWSRHCDGCRREHFPRTDPAVIVAPRSADGTRLLLGANAAWRGEMYSCFAGFVEAGESAERTVHRELQEETGVRLTDVQYVESQAWPYPRSLMLGFHARVIDDAEVRPDGEEIISSRWFTREEIGRGLRGELDVRLPGGLSVAHRLIRVWYDAADETP
ncbi:NTP pyrophosphohydrolase [Microbacterium faecale]|uniref:NAD(+) diphosphatase n=1 Tax=Microbacterium faecale TaxID=1804630 RepID=A0A916Y9T7_9MICO|nr:NAD(+) diphosphatase [Microbacterium faecale]GGD36517.1 NTP pyrophosphohydrolase [Microbacterium faecale]